MNSHICTGTKRAKLLEIVFVTHCNSNLKLKEFEVVHTYSIDISIPD